MKPERIIAGGQTGADRAALDFAFEARIACGGWCPKGRLAEDGPIPAKYPLKETKSAQYPERTRLNVEEADATGIFDTPRGKPSRGTRLTVECCLMAKKSHLILQGFPEGSSDVTGLKSFLEANRFRTLNVAGNRESDTRGMNTHVLGVLRAVLSPQGSPIAWMSDGVLAPKILDSDLA